MSPVLTLGIGLFVGLIMGFTITALMTSAKVSDLYEEIRVLNEMGNNEKRSMSEHERD